MGLTNTKPIFTYINDTNETYEEFKFDKTDFDKLKKLFGNNNSIYEGDKKDWVIVPNYNI